jgi:hypothetical protein
MAARREVVQEILGDLHHKCSIGRGAEEAIALAFKVLMGSLRS